MEVKTAITEVISSSPMPMLEEHVKTCAQCAAKLPAFFEAAQAGKWKLAEKIQGEIADLESLADELKRHTRNSMPRGIWMSVSRPDILELVRVQDKIANRAKDVVGLSIGRELAFPSALSKALAKYIDTIVASVDAAVEVVSATRELSRTAFGPRQIKAISSKSAAVEKLERKSDDLQSRLRAKLRRHEDKLSPVDAIFLYQLLSQIGQIADSAEGVVHRAQIIANS
ncbi:conserved hypothetical protein TIGR00153 [Luminiphilus syltensis NOR5-1B]|uniref:Phosphate transport regulator n=1 Tax=Luminiphilus syltensis NOR5-1B TaxID=565045 RepID=B8KWD3_9GAMM|nr:TIGR00153 family protein [Luminiphilus syltensis]EED36655.1 conserved hypothetical protein TIGR00153 [Luminiphilus syltensis NOR5-1B]